MVFIEGTLSFRVTYGTKTRYIAISVELERKITAIDYHAGIELREKWEQFTHEMVKKKHLPGTLNLSVVTLYMCFCFIDYWNLNIIRPAPPTQ